jgi:PAS domain S-box-containing protein
VKKNKQKRTIFGYFVIAYLLTVIIFTIFRYYDESRKWDEMIRTRLQTGAAMVKYIMPNGYFDTATQPGSVSQPEFQKLSLLLSQASWEGKYKYLYAIKEMNGKFYFIASSNTRKQVSDKQYDPYWLEYTEAPEPLVRAFKSHKAVYAEVTDRWGTAFTVFYPEYSPTGQYYIAGADYDFSYLKGALHSILFNAILQAIILLVLLFLIYLTLTRLQKHYVRKLQFSNSVNESSPIGVMSIQPDGQIDYVNPVFAELIGLSISSLDGFNILDDLGFNKNDELVNRIRICLNRQISWQGEFQNVSLTGKEYWVNVIINYISPEQDGKTMLNIFAEDVTTQMKSRISLGQHNKVLNFLSRAIHNLLANPDMNTTLPDVLEQYALNLNKSQVSILQGSVNTYEVMAAFANAASLDNSIPLNMFSRVQKALNADWEANLENGQIVFGESYDFPISLITLARISNPGIMHLCPIFCDDKYWGFIISLQTQREDSINNELEHTVMRSIADSIGNAIKRQKVDNALRNSIDAKSNFLSSMSHEIRTPLNGVIGMINLMESTQLTAEQKEYAEAIRVSGRLLLNLINNILDISRIEAGKTLLRNDPIGLTACVQAAVNVVNYELREKKLALELSLDAKLPIVIRGDETRLKQIIVNLLHNSIKFTDTGTIRVAVERISKKKIQFMVSDTGIGMNAEQVKNIFEPFYQAGTLAQKLKGTGLGLAISKQLVEIMNGKIMVESEPGHGTSISFTIELPILEDSMDFTEQLPNSEAEDGSQNHSEQLPINMVYLTGGDLDDRVLQNFLISKGYKPLIAETWQKLQNRFGLKEIKLAIVNMSEQNLEKLALLENLRKAWLDYPELRWLILIADTNVKTLCNPPDYKNVLLLPKPLEFEKIINYIKSTLETEIPEPTHIKADMLLEKH